jgi:tetratricopeptide (TPR) repeat protein
MARRESTLMTREKECQVWAIAVSWFFVNPCLGLPQQSTQAEIRRYSVEAENAMAAKDLPAATAALEKLSNLTPDAAQVHANLGLVYYMQNRYTQAIVALEKAAKIDPALPHVNVVLGICLTETGRYKDAVKLLGPAFRSSSPKDQMGRVAGLDLLRACRALQDYPQADEVSAELLRRYPDDAEVLYNSSRLHGEQSLNLILRMIKTAPNSPWVPLAFAQINEDEKQYDSAITQYHLALKMDPRLPGAHLSLGRVLLLGSNTAEATDEALQEFKSELEIDPQNASAEYEIGEIYRKRAQLNEALEHFLKATELEPSLEDAQIALARTLINLHRPKEAIPHLLNAIRLKPTNEVSHFLLATAYGQTGDPVGQEKETALYHQYHARPYSAGTEGQFQLPPGLTSPEVTPQTIDSSDTKQP